MIHQLALAQAIPIADWQFWVVTIVALAAITLAARNVIPGLRKKKTTRVDLTINRDDNASGN